MYVPRSTLLLLLLSCGGTSFAPQHYCLSRRRTPPPAAGRLWTKPSSADDNEIIVSQVEAAERKVQRLNRLLTTLERRSTQDRLEWIQERAILTHKISVLKELLKDATAVQPAPVAMEQVEEEEVEEDQTTETIQALELELDMAREHEDEMLAEQDRLEREVVILQDQIVQIRNLLKSEQYKSAEVEEQYDELVEEQEQERMQYQVQIEAQAREIQAMRDKLQFYEQQQPPPIVSSSLSNGQAQNETMALSS